ncbi:hypothetical protein MFIFM68171_09936 [Madurella fahalii]|uniref:Uncharacterized protein n=1 Tax=Madurella fahalii TaxID=1157608 RepID=A0ABQ0GPR2_9PEZI
MCITTQVGNGASPTPITTNLGVGQCAGADAAGAEIHAHVPHRRLFPASIPAARDGADDSTANFELLFASTGDYDTASEDMQMVLLEFLADPQGAGRRGSSAHLRDEI